MSDPPPKQRYRECMRLARVVNPIAWWLGFRRSFTSASVSLVLVGIISMNIIWGYPWVGLFACCVSLLSVGWLINRFTRPSLNVAIDVPAHVPAEKPLVLTVQLQDRGWLPAMDLRAGLDLAAVDRATERRTGIADASGNRLRRGSHDEYLVAAIPLIVAGDAASFEQTIVFGRRGVHALPPVRVDSLFPFHLFRATHRLQTNATIAVTPKRLDYDSDAVWQTLNATLRGLTARSREGDLIHYVGSREYREGVQVRRWDFSSWARLGKPIVREFNSPSTQSVVILVDPMVPDWNESVASRRLWSRLQSDRCEPLERILSLAAASIETLVAGGVHVELLVLPPSQGSDSPAVHSCAACGDITELLVALAEVEPRTSRVSGSSTKSALDSNSNDRKNAEDPIGLDLSAMALLRTDTPFLMFSCRDRDAVSIPSSYQTIWVGPERAVNSSAIEDRDGDVYSVPAAKEYAR